MEAPPLTSRDAERALSRSNRYRTLGRANPDFTKYLTASSAKASDSGRLRSLIGYQ